MEVLALALLITAALPRLIVGKVSVLFSHILYSVHWLIDCQQLIFSLKGHCHSPPYREILLLREIQG
jgi:hypothetical protein